MATTTATTPMTPSTPGPSKAAMPTRNSSTNTFISPSEMKYIMEGCRENTRLDGRTCVDYRGYTISTNSSMQTAGPLVLSNGSARILLPGGDTHVLCSVKADLVNPAKNTPNDGVVEINVDRALQNTTFASSASSRRQADMELQSLLRRLWLPHVVDLSGLCVVPNQYVWRLHVDLLILASDGNVIDVCAMVMRAALVQTKLPHITPISTSHTRTDGRSATSSSLATMDLALDSDMVNATPPPGVDKCPIVVTVNVLKCPQTVLLLDATAEEEACASCQVSVAVDPQQQGVCGVHKHNTGSVAFGMLASITEMAMQASQHVLAQSVHAAHTNEGTTQDLLHDHFSIR